MPEQSKHYSIKNMMRTMMMMIMITMIIIGGRLPDMQVNHISPTFGSNRVLSYNMRSHKQDPER